jgi:RNA-directed DNA polymerase
LNQAKPFPITKRQVWEAYKRVKANRGGAGVDEQTLLEFDEEMENNLYKLWNRLASGSYHPPPVKRVEIPKADGGIRPLGIPTVADRIAQTVVKQVLEPELEKYFHPDSYGYRPGKSAHDAIGQARKRCWKNDWVVDLDIKGFFAIRPNPVDAPPHTGKLGGALFERWLKVAGRDAARAHEGHSEGAKSAAAVIMLFDAWMQRTYPPRAARSRRRERSARAPFCRADIYCR